MGGDEGNADKNPDVNATVKPRVMVRGESLVRSQGVFVPF